MTEKLFWESPYRTELETTVTGVCGNDVEVERTIFYAFSGGQESDHGMIAGVRVTEARKHRRAIVYTLEDGHGLAAGDRVRMVIEWPRRYRLMRLHFAAEIVLELVYRRFREIRKIGAHIAEDKARIDFQWQENLTAVLPEIESQARAIIRSNQPITSAFSDEAAERRYWQIAEFPPVPCGGTHLRTTGEVGDIALRRRNPGKGKERIEVLLCDAAVGHRA